MDGSISCECKIVLSYLNNSGGDTFYGQRCILPLQGVTTLKQDALCSVDVAASVGKRVSFDLQSVKSNGGGVVQYGVSTVEN
jgi:hypothetical protein